MAHTVAHTMTHTVKVIVNNISEMNPPARRRSILNNFKNRLCYRFIG